MKILKCDLCEDVVTELVQVEVLDGEHPHNGSTMYKTIDCCSECIMRLNGLKLNSEYSDLKLAFNR